MPRQEATEIGVVPGGAGDDREHREALPRCCRLADHVVIVRADRAPHLDHLRAPRPDELPHRPPRRAPEQHALVLRERGDRARGAASLEVPRRREHAGADRAERPRDQPAVAQPADAEREVDALVNGSTIRCVSATSTRTSGYRAAKPTRMGGSSRSPRSVGAVSRTVPRGMS